MFSESVCLVNPRSAMAGRTAAILPDNEAGERTDRLRPH
jgi:hypothetical protein